jgi:hypothetical protein
MKAGFLLLTTTCVLFISTARAATVALWTFESPNIPPTVTGTSISGLAPNAGSGTASGVHASGSSVFSSAIGNGSAHALSANNWAPGDYWEFHVSTVGFTDLQLSFAQRSDNIGPTNFSLTYSLDHITFTTIGPSFFEVRADNSLGTWNSSTSNTNTIKTFDLSATNVLENAPDVYFRLTSTFGNPPSGTSRIDDFSIMATAIPEPNRLALVALLALLVSSRCLRNYPVMKTRPRPRSVLVSVLLAGAAVCPFAARSASSVLLSNLDQQPGDPSSAFISSNVWDGQLFITGPQPARFDSVTFSIRGGFAGTFWVTVYSDDNGVPGTPLPGGLLSGPTHPSGLSTYSASSSITLAPNTTYWAVGSTDEPGTSGQSYGMYMVLNSNYTASAGWQLPNHLAYTTDAGNTWVSTENALIPRPFYISVSGQVIPEPPAAALLIGALVLVSLLRRRM